MLPLLSVVDETCTTLVIQLLDPQSPISIIGSVHKLLETLRSLFLKLSPKKQKEKSRGKLLSHRNAQQREAISHIVSLQMTLEKPLHFDKLSLVVEEIFHIMSSKNCLPIFRRHDQQTDLEEPLEVGRTRKKDSQKRIRNLGWVLFSKEETIHVTLVEINQRTVVGLTVQELIPSLDTVYP